MKTIRYISLALFAAVLLGACTKDLDTKPINKDDFTSDQAYDSPESYMQGLAKIYAGFVVVGQEDPGKPEINVSDAGSSELNRAFWSLQELTTDAAKCAWNNDSWAIDINFNTWSDAPNDGIAAVYYRTVLVVTLTNEYLRQTSDGKLSERGVDDKLRATIQKYRAEARFLRAYAYWMAMDIFGNMPFVTENDPIGKYFPPQIKRADLFRFIEGELLELELSPDMAEARANEYPRADKGAVRGLLARMYLNAEVYSGEKRYSDAMTYAGKVIADFTLADNYADLFKADNDMNPDARREIVFSIAYDATYTRSYGGTSYFINSTFGPDDPDKTLIGSDGWSGNRVNYEFVKKFGVSNADYETGTFDCPDRRALFHIKGRSEEMNDAFAFSEGWGVMKFSNRTSGGVLTNIGAFSSTDLPLIRAGEMYLIYAEASLRNGGSPSDAVALGYVNDVRRRAGLDAIPNYDLSYLLEERARELYWEGHRRTDLIRFGKYVSSDYLWPYKGGVKSGKGLSARYNLFPLMASDVDANPNLVQNPGY